MIMEREQENFVLRTHPDATLRMLARAYEIARSRADDTSLPEADSTSAWEVMTSIEFAMHQIPARTLEGLKAKAQIAAEYAPMVDPKQPLLDDIVMSVIEDIIRLPSLTVAQGSVA